MLRDRFMCCSVLQVVAVALIMAIAVVNGCSVAVCYCAVCCSVLQCVAACCSVLQCDTFAATLHHVVAAFNEFSVRVCCSVLQRVAVCCSVV